MRMPSTRRSFLGGLSAAGAAIGLTQGRATAHDDRAPGHPGRQAGAEGAVHLVADHHRER